VLSSIKAQDAVTMPFLPLEEEGCPCIHSNASSHRDNHSLLATDFKRERRASLAARRWDVTVENPGPDDEGYLARAVERQCAVEADLIFAQPGWIVAE
jgi:hypothetical protein